MSQFIYQQKQAWASLSKKPGFIATVVTTMGLTLGALLCVLTLGYLLLMEPLPYPEQDSLFKVDHVIVDANGENKGRAYTYPGLIHLYENQDVFETAGLIHYGQDVLTSLPSQPTLYTSYVTPEWFDMLGAKMALGRKFEQSEAVDTNHPVAILSYELWRDEYNKDPNILDKKVDFSGTSFKVIGVLDESYVEPQIVRRGMPTGVWFPWDYNLATRLKDRWTNINGALTFVGKLKSDISKTQAEQTITPIVNDTWVENVQGVAFFAGWTINMELKSFQSQILGESEGTVFLLLAGVIGLVIIASANIANLFMSRTAEQQRQLAIFAALGAKKSQLFKTIFAETGLLMGLSVLLALAVSAFGFYILQQHLVSVLPRVNELAINGFTLAAAIVLALLFAFLFAGLNRKMINYKALNSMLQSSGKGTGIQVSKKTRQFLIVSQVAIATVLVFANISLFKEAYNTITEPKGYTIDNMAQLTLSVSAPSFPPAEEVIPVMQELRKKLTQLPQVESVSIAGSPLNGYGIWALTSVGDNSNYTPNSKGIDDMYFDMLGMQLLEGDNFTSADIQDRNMVMIVNDVFAKQLNPNGSALGMQINPGGDRSFTIIGVVKGIKLPGAEEIPARVYTPTSPASSVFTINLVDGQKITREQAVATIAEVSGLYALHGLDYLTDIERQQLFTQYATAVTTAVLATLTLFLAGVGLYGILSYSTQMRRFELGTRMAIGAKRKHLVGLIIKDNSTIIFAGVLVSLVILAGLYVGYGELVAGYLTAGLIGMFALTVAAIGGLSLFACYWPLRQFINQPAVHSLRGSD
jgi:predicted permease